MSAEEVTRYLQAIEEPKRRTFETLRQTILEITPDAETIAGFAAFKNHLSYLPSAAACCRSLPTS